MTRPSFNRKADRLIHPGSTATDIRHDHACAGFDRAAREADIKWGQDRLIALVSPATAEKFGSALAKLNAALAGDDPAETATRAAVCLRGFAAMDAEATAAGHQPITPDAIEIEVDGKLCAVLRDQDAWPAYAAARPGVRTYSLREVANALAAYGSTVAAVKDAFPRAEISDARKPTPLEAALDDHLPF